MQFFNSTKSKAAALSLLVLSLTLIGSTVLVGGVFAQDSGDETNYCQWPQDMFGDCEGEVLTPGEVDNLEDALALYQQAATQEGMVDTFHTTYSNYMSDTQDIAWLQAERAIAQSAADDLSETEAQINVEQNVSDYYTTKQHNLIETWNTHIATLESIHAQDDTDRVEVADRSAGYYHTEDNWFIKEDGSQNTGESIVEIVGFNNKSITLANGNTTQVNQIQLRAAGYGDTNNWFNATANYNPFGGLTQVSHSYGPAEFRFKSSAQVRVKPPQASSYTQQVLYLYGSNWEDPYQNATQLHSEVLTETDTFVSNAYADLRAGNINATDVLSNVNLMNHYMTNANSDNLTFNDALVALAASGVSTPNLNETGWMDISYNPHSANTTNTYEGVLMSSQAPPNGTWETGVQYDSENISGNQMIARLDGSIKNLNGTFAIETVYDRSGDERNVSVIDSPDRDYSVANTTDMQALITELGDLRAQLDELQEANGTGGGGGLLGGGDWIPDVNVPSIPGMGMLESLITVVVVAVLLMIVLSASFATSRDPRRGS